MGDYEFLPHTADEKFRVSAPTLDDAFITSVKAFYEILLGDAHVPNVESREIHIEAKKLTTLLYDFLNELVYYFDGEDVLLPNVESLAIDGEEGNYSLTATLTGDKQYDYDLRTEIKNMTYSEMEVEEKDGVWELIVVVDI